MTGCATPLASEAELRRQLLGIGMVTEHLAVEPLARVPPGGIAQSGSCEPPARGADDGEPEIGGILRRHLDVDALAQAVDPGGIEAVMRAVIGEDAPERRVDVGARKGELKEPKAREDRIALLGGDG